MFLRAIIILSTVSSALSDTDGKVTQLESFNADPGMVSVSGLSSGAAFTNSFMVAHSSYLKGAGIFAGVPYGCTAPEADLCRNVTGMIEYAYKQEEAGLIDPLDNLIDKPIYVYHGQNDWLANPISGRRSAEFFTDLDADVRTNFTNTCGHGTPSLDQGIECSRTWLPGVNNCAWSGAYHVLNHIYGGDLVEPQPQETLIGQWVEFDQTEFTRGIFLHSFADTGFAYYPSGCLDRSKVCKVHVSVHGCFIVSWLIGDKYAKHTGHNEVGELNDIIVIHPQLTSTLNNPIGCWGGGEGADTHDGVEIRVVMRMIDRVLGIEE